MLRVLAVLAALTVLGGVLRFDAAADPSAYQSKDEQSYAMIARALAVTGHYGNPGMTDPVHWPPGAPLMFAAAYKLHPAIRGGGVWDVPAAYPLQALVGTLTIPAVFLLVLAVAGAGLLVPGGGRRLVAPTAAHVLALVAAGAIAVYPPLVSASGDLLSEPLGALLLTSALAATAWALGPLSVRRLLLAGVLLGATVLTRADLALVPVLALLTVAVTALLRSRSLGDLLHAVVPMLVALLVVVTPWTVFASRQAGHLVALSSGGASNLWVGTYLPGGGSMFGAKRALADEVRARDPALRGKRWFQLRQTDVIATVAARHPGLGADAALSEEGRANLRRYLWGDPVGFARMGVHKIWRLWGGYTVGTYRNTRTWIHVLHLLIAGLGLVGLVAGLVATRRRPALWLLAAVLLSVTAVNAVLVSEARHNLTLMPVVAAVGAAGLALALARRREAAVTAAAPAGQQPRVAAVWGPAESRTGDAAGPGR
jgi:hypothetical protein